jgi:hypothetical protein
MALFYASIWKMEFFIISLMRARANERELWMEVRGARFKASFINWMWLASCVCVLQEATQNYMQKYAEGI